jgi:hypothetical protein
MIFCPPETGVFVAAETGRRPFAGHLYTTPDVAARKEAYLWFHSPLPGEEERWEFLASQGIGWLWHSRTSGAPPWFDPARSSFLEKAYDGGSVAIYRVAGVPP